MSSVSKSSLLNDPIGLIEYGFGIAFERQNEAFATWRRCYKILEAARRSDVPFDLGDNDAYIDCLLREMEAGQVRYCQATGESMHPHSRTRLQIQLSRYWIMATYEVIRETAQVAQADNVLPVSTVKVITELRDLLGAYRIPIAKQEPHNSRKNPRDDKAVLMPMLQPDGTFLVVESRYAGNGNHRAIPFLDSENGSILFPTYDGNSYSMVKWSRLTISDHVQSVVLSLDVTPEVARPNDA